MNKIYTVTELNNEVKSRLHRADAADCYIDESGDVVLADGAEAFADLSGMEEINEAVADTNTVEYYDNLPVAERAEYRENTDYQVSTATRAEFDRIDAGVKATCLS
jgi:hypothetical protein